MKQIKIAALILSILVTSPSYCMQEAQTLIEQFKSLAQQSNSLFLDAAQKGQDNVIETLLPYIDRNTRTVDGASALLLASERGHVSTVWLLLQQPGSDPNEKSLKGLTPLLQAVDKGHVEIVELLLNNGARATIDTRGANGATPLFLACLKKHTKIVKLLIDANADPTISDPVGHLPLHAASQKGDLGAVQMLLQILPLMVYNRNHYGYTALHTASYYGKIEVAKLLITSKADPTAQNDEGRTPLNYARSLEMRELLECHAVQQFMSDDRVTPTGPEAEGEQEEKKED